MNRLVGLGGAHIGIGSTVARLLTVIAAASMVYLVLGILPWKVVQLREQRAFFGKRRTSTRAPRLGQQAAIIVGDHDLAKAGR
jgi:hypothetical protein